VFNGTTTIGGFSGAEPALPLPRWGAYSAPDPLVYLKGLFLQEMGKGREKERKGTGGTLLLQITGSAPEHGRQGSLGFPFDRHPPQKTAHSFS